MTAAIIVVALAVGAIAYIVAPIGRWDPGVDESSEIEAEEKKRVALIGILDLEEERDGGKLSEAEFIDLRARYERDALAALQELDKIAPAATVEERLEREIAAARERLGCGTCGAPRVNEGAPCASCGSSY